MFFTLVLLLKMQLFTHIAHNIISQPAVLDKNFTAIPTIYHYSFLNKFKKPGSKLPG